MIHLKVIASSVLVRVECELLASEDELLCVQIRVALLYSYLLSISGINAQTGKSMNNRNTSQLASVHLIPKLVVT